MDRGASPGQLVARPLRLSVDLGADAALAALGSQFGNAVAISPDGSTLAFVAQPSLRRPVPAVCAAPGRNASNGARRHRGSECAVLLSGWTLDRIRYRARSEEGGRHRWRADSVVTSEMSFRGAAWSAGRNAVLLTFADSGHSRLMRLPPTGGTPSPVTTLAPGDAIHAWPQLLPGGKAVLYTSSLVTGAFNDSNLVIQRLPDRHVHSRPTGRLSRCGMCAAATSSTSTTERCWRCPLTPGGWSRPGRRFGCSTALDRTRITGGAQFSISDTGALRLSRRSEYRWRRGPWSSSIDEGTHHGASHHAGELVHAGVRGPMARKSRSGFARVRRSLATSGSMRLAVRAARPRHFGSRRWTQTGLDARRPPHHLRVGPRGSRPDAELVLAVRRRIGHGATTDDQPERDRRLARGIRAAAFSRSKNCTRRRCAT